MKLQGTFLRSRTGRRIFWTLLLAAAVPIGLFGLATHAMLSDHFESLAQRQQVQLTKFAGMGLLDRLVVARTALGIVSRTGRIEADSTVLNRRGRVLLQTVHLDATGRASDGDVALAQAWREHQRPAAPSPANDTSMLVLGAMNEASGTRQVLMAVRRADRPGELWIGELDPAFLFGELASEANGARICVFDDARTVFCPGRTDQPPPAAMSAQREWHAAWSLFLRSDFGIDDWTLVGLDAPNDTASATPPLVRLAALGAALTLLLVGMLALVQVRRTMVPLERLIEGTRRLAERDYGTRVAVPIDDEFGELARSFNRMAERIGGQMQALQVQSAIDREILNGLNVARVLQRVAQRLEQLVPGGSAAVVELDRASRMLARVHTADAPLMLVSVARAEAMCFAEMPADHDVLCAEPPPWLVRALPRLPTRLRLRCAKVGDEMLGLLVIGGEGADVESPDTLREIAELADRVSVTLASADRERRLLERATRDSLTGLANRAGLYEFIEQRLAGALPEPFTVMFIDLDRFKEVNDSLGHHVGDELLRAVARRLQQCVPAGTLVARPGGDEFVLVLPGPRSAADDLAPQLCAELAHPVPLGGRAVTAGASIGMAHHPEHGIGSSDLMRRADMAMYTAKGRGGGTAAWFDVALDARMGERVALLNDLRHALTRGEFELHYQPRIDRRSGAVAGAEALLRWRHPEQGWVPVPVFIELLEETGLIDRVGLWVIGQASAQLQRWRAQGLALQSIAVNLSSRQLHDPSLPDRVAALLAQHGLRPEQLELEVTESIFVGDSAPAIAVLQRLHDSGVRIALDDFGTGYSSLSYLHKLPIGVLKVDRSFVVELGQRDSALALARSIVALARALDMRVVAEGVETREQADLLIQLGCDELQGFLFARPLPADAFEAFAASRDTEATAAV